MQTLRMLLTAYLWKFTVFYVFYETFIPVLKSIYDLYVKFIFYWDEVALPHHHSVLHSKMYTN